MSSFNKGRSGNVIVTSDATDDDEEFARVLKTGDLHNSVLENIMKEMEKLTISNVKMARYQCRIQISE